MTGKFDSWSMVVYKDKAYLFTGSPRVDYFDLITGRWGHISTTLMRSGGRSRSWPHPHNRLSEYTMQVAHGKLYVFGGKHTEAAIGCNVFMSLDIETKRWEILSGTVQCVADSSCPGPRRYTSSWIDGTNERFMLMYGEADRMGAKMAGQPQGGFHGYGYDDLWSWHLKDRKWRRERIVGNPPCPRSEMAVNYVC